MNKKINYVKIALLTIILADLVKNTIKKNKATITTESFVIPKDPENANDSAHRLLKAASQYCKK
ncbi:hypothetical protein [Staphylococcus devriesei]|uniref:hypothetical protein n=1 Tax=Staphylococcus devriesei TaxID=586733 RepID=UPI000CD096CB|nr:hypothetical protein [Staphylococcus devriesei]PNZ85714.1 hypothetical protein CD147_11225 [Staphylococcus devriesei]SUM03890.1 Uncharacterised protein [Staphylococcus devriesei]